MRLSRTLLTGALFLLSGLLVMVFASNYRMGVLRHMGPGFFPMSLGIIVAVIGAIFVLKAFFSSEEDGLEIPQFALRPIAAVTAAAVAFALLLPRLGLLPALAGLIVVARITEPDNSLRELALMTVVISAVATGIFVFALKLPIALLAW